MKFYTPPITDLNQITTRVHNELTGLSANDHPQYGLIGVPNSWTGLQTFNTIPSIPVTTPTTGDQVASKTYVDSVAGATLYQNIVLAETFTQGQMGAFGDGATSQTTDTGALTPLALSLYTNHWAAQAFTTPSPANTLTQIVFSFHNTNGGSFPYDLRITIDSDNAGAPSGTHLYSGSATGTIGGAADLTITHNLTTPLAVSASTKYWIVVHEFSDPNHFNMNMVPASTNKGQISVDGGATWVATTNDFYNTWTITTSDVTKAYLASSASSNLRFKNVIGFAAAAGAIGETVKFDMEGYITYLSGLTQGATYYMNDANGSIGTSAGSQSRKVGRALQTTSLAINIAPT